jgi:hypothetical protein
MLAPLKASPPYSSASIRVIMGKRPSAISWTAQRRTLRTTVQDDDGPVRYDTTERAYIHAGIPDLRKRSHVLAAFGAASRFLVVASNG